MTSETAEAAATAAAAAALASYTPPAARCRYPALAADIAAYSQTASPTRGGVVRYKLTPR